MGSCLQVGFLGSIFTKSRQKLNSFLKMMEMTCMDIDLVIFAEIWIVGS